MLPRALIFVALVFPLAAEKWALQYHYDRDGKELHIADIAFPSGTQGIAVGTLLSGILSTDERRPQSLALVSSDGGAHWAEVVLKDTPRSLFFLNDTTGWMVGANAIWTTTDAGLTWNRISNQIKPKGKMEGAPAGGVILRVHFLNATRGWAIGFQKTVMKTEDGGRTWTPLAEAAQPNANPALSAYTQIAFADETHGKIVGHVLPKPDDDPEGLPPWMMPERALQRRFLPLPSFELDTRDGGRTWTSSTAAVVGSITSLSMKGQLGLAILSYDDSAEWPSEVIRLDFAARKNASIFRQKDRIVTDARVVDSGAAFLAAVEPAGRLRSVPVPGKVKILRSADGQTFSEMPVDYRAVAQDVILAGPDAQHLWAATDTGMILRLEP